MDSIKTIGSKTVLSAGNLTAVIDSFGAKVLALADGDDNRLFYDADDISHSGIPLCFPSFGPLHNGELLLGDESYPMNQHGFIRDAEFIVEKLDENEALLTLDASEETLKRYPYDFAFSVLYTLSEEGLSIAFSWLNDNDEPAPFSPGVHPYFTVYERDNIRLQTKAVKGNLSEDFSQIVELEESGFFTRCGETCVTVKGAPDINLIDHGYEETIAEVGEGKTITLDYDSDAFDRLTIWRKNAEVDYLCIEPANAQNKINENPEMIPAGAVWESVVEIRV